MSTLRTPRLARVRKGLPWLLVACLPGTAGAATITAVAAPTPLSGNLLADGGFETPNLPANNFTYAPQNAAWAFPVLTPGSNSAGIASNGSGFGNGTAPEGDQVMFVQGGGPASTLVTATQGFQAAAGQYRLTLKAAQRKVGNVVQNQTVRVLVDGVEIGLVKPPTNAYAVQAFDGITLAAGAHVMAFVGLNPAGGDNTAFIDDVQLLPLDAVARPWSQNASWVGGVKPQAGDEVIIPAGARVIYDEPAAAPRTLTVAGEFHCAEADTALLAEWIMVHGRFACGSVFSPLEHAFTVTLRGAKDSDDIMGMGDKFFGAMSGAQVELHGARRSTWTRLAAIAPAGGTVLTLQDAVNWKVGDQVVVAPSRESGAQGEVVTITGTKPSLKQVFFTPPLQYEHYAGVSEFTNDAMTWHLDDSAEAGLLTRRIRFVGEIAAGPQNAGYGGHLMTMAGSVIHASGIELFQMGQKSLLGRYPFHWHLVGDATGQYLTDSSIHHSFNRCVTVHGTNSAVVADNVCYDFIGHGYFLEDGYERYNVFDHNLGILARKPLPNEAVPMPVQPGEVMDTDYRDGASNASTGPAVFWISNATNTYTNNAAAGSEGTGYWYHLFDSVAGASASLPGAGTIVPRTSAFGIFDNNRVHSSRQGFSSCRQAGGPLGMDSAGVVITGLHVSHAQQGIWPCASDTRRENAVFEQAIVANSPNGMQAPAPMRFKDSVLAGYTENEQPNPFPFASVGSVAVSVYDQGFVFDNVHFVNYDRAYHTVFQPAGGAHKLTNNRLDRVTFENAPNVFHRFPEDYASLSPAVWSEPIHIADARPFGIAGAVVPPHPVMADIHCAVQLTPNFPGYLCPYRYVQFRADHSPPSASPVAMTVLRSDGAHGGGTHIPSRYVAAAITGGPYSYAYRYDKGITSNYVQLGIEAAFPGDAPVVQLLDVPSNVALYNGGSGWTQASTLAQLRGLSGRGYFRDAGSGSIYLKLLASGAPWYAYDLVGLCMNGVPGCSVSQGRSITPPAVTITSPSDGARVPAGVVTFSATVTPATLVQSVRLYIGDDFKGEVTAAPYSIGTSLAPGRYPVKLVVRFGANQTYTAVQQVIVGEPEDRFMVATPPNESTYVYGTVPGLALNFVNWTPAAGGKHLHWFDNGVFKGEITGTAPTSLAGLTQGRHVIRIAQADAGHVPRAIEASVVVHVMQNGVIADFEDGVDTRATLTTHDIANPMGIINSWPGVPGVDARNDNEDERNWFDIPAFPNDNTTTTATYRMNFTPGQNWAGYGKIEMLHWGPAFDLYAVYANAGVQFVAGYPHAPWPVTTQRNFTPLAGDTLVALELRHSEAASALLDRQQLFYIRLVQ